MIPKTVIASQTVLELPTYERGMNPECSRETNYVAVSIKRCFSCDEPI